MKSVVLLILLITTGCATSTPRFLNQRAPDSATLLPRHPLTGVAIIIMEVDGHPTFASAFTTVYVPPGKRMVGIRLNNWGASATDVFPLEVIAGHQYSFDAEFTGAAFTLQMIDDTEKKGVANWRVITK